jgi:hypothetical protein
MNKLLLALKRRLQWRLLALIDAPFPPDREPTDEEKKQRLESLSFGEQLQLMTIVKILSLFDKGEKTNEAK